MSKTDETPEERRIRSKTKKVNDMSEGNAKTYAEIQQAIPGFELDPGNLRRELLIEFLEDQGIITAEQRLDFEIITQTRIEEALGQWMAKVKEHEAMQNFVVAQKPTRLLDQHGRPIGG